MPRNSSDEFFQEVLNRAVQQEQQNNGEDPEDTVIYYVIKDGREYPIMEKRQRLELEADPENPGNYIPHTSKQVGYYVNDDGGTNDIEAVAFCRFGCRVVKATLVRCNACGNFICKRHSTSYLKKYYCKSLKTRCSWTGFLGSCFKPVLGFEE